MTVFREYTRGLTHVDADGGVWTDRYDVTCMPPPSPEELARIQASMQARGDGDALAVEDDASEDVDAPDEGDW